MNSIAQRALASAFGRGLPAPTAKESLPELVITGPINRVMELEGKRYAVEVIRAFGASLRRPDVVAKAIANLTRTAAAMPSSYASGIKQVIDLLEATP